MRKGPFDPAREILIIAGGLKYTSTVSAEHSKLAKQLRVYWCFVTGHSLKMPTTGSGSRSRGGKGRNPRAASRSEPIPDSPGMEVVSEPEDDIESACGEDQFDCKEYSYVYIFIQL